jgi:hypothetical protein
MFMTKSTVEDRATTPAEIGKQRRAADLVQTVLGKLQAVRAACDDLTANLVQADSLALSDAASDAGANLYRFGTWCAEVGDNLLNEAEIPSPWEADAARDAAREARQARRTVTKGIKKHTAPIQAPTKKGDHAMLALPLPFRGWRPTDVDDRPEFRDAHEPIDVVMRNAARFNWNRMYDCDTLDFWAVVIAKHRINRQRIWGWLIVNVPNRWRPESPLDFPPALLLSNINKSDAVNKAVGRNREALIAGDSPRFWSLPIQPIDENYLPSDVIERIYQMVAVDRNTGRHSVVAEGISEPAVEAFLETYNAQTNATGIVAHAVETGKRPQSRPTKKPSNNGAVAGPNSADQHRAHWRATRPRVAGR